jgi:hypothetical protein
MHTSIYKINKGINKSIEFKGLKAQYIWWLGAGLVLLMVLFAILFIAGVNPYACVGLILVAGLLLFTNVYRLSNKYGEYGMQKKIAKRNIPKIVRCYRRDLFLYSKKK